MTRQIADQTLLEIETLTKIARANGAHVSIHDLSELNSAGLTEAELRRAWKSNPLLSSAYPISNGIVLEAKGLAEDPSQALERENGRKMRALEYLASARRFAALCKSGQVRLLSVSGSTSYLSTGPIDDLDFFLVSGRDSLWILLAKSLILARVFHFFHSKSPRICFSFAVDEELAERGFGTTRDSLSARDALTTVVVKGTEFYTRLLRKNPWISSFYPRLYQQKTLDPNPETDSREESSPSRRFLNLFAYLVVGNYVKLKSELLNRQLQKQQKNSSIFTVRMSKSQLVFESTRYVNLRRMYRKLSNVVASGDPLF